MRFGIERKARQSAYQQFHKAEAKNSIEPQRTQLHVDWASLAVGEMLDDNISIEEPNWQQKLSSTIGLLCTFFQFCTHLVNTFMNSAVKLYNKLTGIV